MQLKAGPSRFFAFTRLTEPVEEDEYILVPVTQEVVERLQKESANPKREIPDDWIAAPSRYDYRAGPRDLLQVIVWDHPELNITAATGGTTGDSKSTADAQGAGGGGARVSPDGSMFFPLVGTIPVAGKTVEEIRRLLTRALSQYFTDPQVDVRVIGFNSKKAHVVGAVKEPRDVALTDVPLRLIDAVNAAGGPAPSAALDNVRVIRRGRQLRVNLFEIYARSREEENILLQDGDIVQVEDSSLEKIFVMGEVQKQGVTTMERGQLTLATALQSSGGINQETADAGRVMVLRQGKDKPLVYYLNVNEPDLLMLSTRFPLEHSDVVYVSTADVYNLGKIMRTLLLPVQYGISGAAMAR